MICPACKKVFEPQTVTQKFCSKGCGKKWRYHHGGANREALEFRCAYCGKVVVTEGKNDMRTRFCSQGCEKKYWRHPNRIGNDVTVRRSDITKREG